ncbi:MAG: outer membrane lipoprotein carrier protein LolA [Prevotella sp.]|nr:outer membrane lipoprotein carrier protein LolA [Prevotella sp.]
MRKILLSCLLVFLSPCLPMMGQTKLTAEQQKQIVEKIDKASSAMKTMQCDFTQTKRMKMLSKDMQSKGVMYFKRPDKLRWQYTSPYDYTFIMNGDKVQIKSMKSTKNIDVQQNKMFRQITNIILSSITGGTLRTSADFTVELWQQDKSYFVKLYPKKKELKQLYQYLEIWFDPALTKVSTVKMMEKTGDMTIVNLLNTKYGVTINEKMFATD